MCMIGSRSLRRAVLHLNNTASHATVSLLINAVTFSKKMRLFVKYKFYHYADLLIDVIRQFKKGSISDSNKGNFTAENEYT